MMATAEFQSIVPSMIPFRVPHAVEGMLSRMLGIDEIEHVYGVLRAMGEGRSIAERLLDYLAVTYSASAVDLARIPKSGATILTVNHPFGILEGAVLAAMLRGIRSDVRFLANGILTVIPEVRDLVVAVDPISGSKAVAPNGSGLRRSLEHLSDGGMLVVFPAGEVSHFQWRDRAVSDSPWSPAVARMVGILARRGIRVMVSPAYVAGANSPLFQLAGMAHAGLRTALLGRELLNKRGRHVEVRAGTPVPPDKLLAMAGPQEQVDYLRWRTYLLARRERYKPLSRLPLPGRRKGTHLNPPAAPAPPAEVAAEIAALPQECRLNQSGDLEVYLTPAAPIPHVLHEIGRLREITFRAAGEGSGKALDLDDFDTRYLHLFVWNSAKQEVVGAYRLACTQEVRAQWGVNGLYTATLFRFGDPFLDRLGPALELGRSFIRPEYQKGFAPLLLLWKGIGAYVARHPQHRVLFGPVSISNRYQAVSRELMVSFLEKYALLQDWAGLVRNRRGLRRASALGGAQRPALPAAELDLEDLAALVGDIEEEQAGVPVLLRQYLKLGGKLLSFSEDPKFSDVLDGLILVDLTKTEPRLLERYLGKKEAATFLAYQRGNHGTH